MVSQARDGIDLNIKSIIVRDKGNCHVSISFLYLCYLINSQMKPTPLIQFFSWSAIHFEKCRISRELRR